MLQLCRQKISSVKIHAGTKVANKKVCTASNRENIIIEKLSPSVIKRPELVIKC